MKAFTTLVVLCAVTLALAKANKEQYTDRYDHMDVQEVIQNRALLIRYIKCLLHQAKCTPEGIELKSHIKEALQNNCAKCTEAQQRATRIIIKHLINHEEAYWKQLVAFYDPEGKFTAKYEKELLEAKKKS